MNQDDGDFEHVFVVCSVCSWILGIFILASSCGNPAPGPGPIRKVHKGIIGTMLLDVSGCFLFLQGSDFMQNVLLHALNVFSVLVRIK